MSKVKKVIQVKDVILVFILSILVGGMYQVYSNNLGKDIELKVADYYIENNAELSGSANLITSVLASYRGFDTLGEVTILFLATTGIAALFSAKGKKIIKADFIPNEVLRISAKILFPVLVLYGVYIIVHGHLSPGGGFQGGAVIASAFLLLLVAEKDFTVSEKVIAVSESLSGVIFVLLGILGLFIAAAPSFLANFLPHGAERVGELFSAGLIPVISLLIGIKVSMELTGLLQTLLED